MNKTYIKNYIPILGIFLAEYPINTKFFFVFFVYQVSMCGLVTFLVSYYFLYSLL